MNTKVINDRCVHFQPMPLQSKGHRKICTKKLETTKFELQIVSLKNIEIAFRVVNSNLYQTTIFRNLSYESQIQIKT